MIFYSGNIIVHGGSGMKSFPLASSDMAGTWTVTVRDMLSGQTVIHKLDVESASSRLQRGFHQRRWANRQPEHFCRIIRSI